MKLLTGEVAATPETIMAAVIGLVELIPFAPQTGIAKKLLASELENFVTTQSSLDALVNTAIRTQREWQGVAELRGLYCALGFEPKDGVRVAATTPGFTPAEIAERAEQSYFERQSRETEEKLALWRAERAALPPAEQKAIGDWIETFEALSAGYIPRRHLETASPKPASRPGQSAPIVIHATRARTPEEHQAEVTRLELALRNRGRDTATPRLQQILEG